MCKKVRSRRKCLIRLCPAGGTPRPGCRRCSCGCETGEPVRFGACSLPGVVLPCGTKGSRCLQLPTRAAGLEGTLAEREPGPRRGSGRTRPAEGPGSPTAAEVLSPTPACPSVKKQLQKPLKGLISRLGRGSQPHRTAAQRKEEHCQPRIKSAQNCPRSVGDRGDYCRCLLPLVTGTALAALLLSSGRVRGLSREQTSGRYASSGIY